MWISCLPVTKDGGMASPGKSEIRPRWFTRIMSSHLRVTFARLCFETRTMLDISQQALADSVGVSRAYISTIESGRANPSLDLVGRVADRLGIEIDLLARPPLVLAIPQHDLVHARCSGYLDRRLRRASLEVRREVEIVHGRSHGWIDLLAFDRRTGTMLIIEVKTRLDDLGAIERQLGWYERSAMGLAREMGWRPKRVAGWLIALASDEVESFLRANADALRAAFPVRADRMSAIIGGQVVPDASSRGLALIVRRVGAASG